MDLPLPNGGINCAFVSLPLEVRHTIYGYLAPTRLHISQILDGFLLSQCLQPHQNSDFDGTERTPKKNDTTNVVWARRLDSMWGPHWECEEVALRMHAHCSAPSCSGLAALLVTCKYLYIEVLDFLTTTVVFNVDSPNIIDSLVRANTDPFNCIIENFDNRVLGFTRMRRLSVTLMLPVEHEHQTKLLTLLSSTISSFKEIRHLDIWFDHKEAAIWAIMDERSIFKYLQPLAKVSGLRISVCLPHLHPGKEDPLRHFTADSPPPLSAFQISRRLRQRYRTTKPYEDVRMAYGVLVKPVPDFPFSYEIGDRRGGRKGAELIEYERSFWKGGIDVQERLEAVGMNWNIDVDPQLMQMFIRRMSGIRKEQCNRENRKRTNEC